MFEDFSLSTVRDIIVITAAIGGVWWRAHTRINAVEQDLQRFKLQVARENVTSNHLKELENRLIGTLDKLSEDLKDLRNALLSRTSDK